MGILIRLAQGILPPAATVVPPGPPASPPQQAARPLATLNPEPVAPLMTGQWRSAADKTISDTLATTTKVYNAIMGDRLASPAAPIHNLHPSALMRIIGHRFTAPDGPSKPPVHIAQPQAGEVNYAAYDYERRHGIVGRISQ